MKERREVSVLLIIVVAAAMLGWTSSDPPEGHIESSSHNPDRTVYPSGTSSIGELYGTAQKDQDNQTDANSVLNSYKLYRLRDRNGDHHWNAEDLPIGSTALSSSISGTDTTIPVDSAAWFSTPGFVKIGSEYIRYTGKTATSLTGCTRGYLTSSAATHSAGDNVQRTGAWDKVLDATVDGSPYDAKGWDTTGGVGSDNGTEGDLLQDDGVDDLSVNTGEKYLYVLRVIDASGNTNMEDGGGTDEFHPFPPDGFIDEDGNPANVGNDAQSAEGLEDDEVLSLRVNEPPR